MTEFWKLSDSPIWQAS